MIKQRKLFLILIIAIGGIFIFSFLLLLVNLSSIKTAVAPSPAPIPTAIQVSIAFPSTQKVAVPLGQMPAPSQQPIISPVVTPQQGNQNSVIINNIFAHPLAETPQGDVLFVNQPDQYQIVYLSQFNKFHISITGSPFDLYRQQAEQAFIKSLGITQSEACMLDVEATTPISINPNNAGISYPLSFCGGGGEGPANFSGQ